MENVSEKTLFFFYLNFIFKYYLPVEWVFISETDKKFLLPGLCLLQFLSFVVLVTSE